MIDGIPLAVSDVGGWGLFVVLAIVIVTAFLRGNITSRREVVAERDRADSWQKAWAVERAANREKDEMVVEILGYSKTTAHAMEEIQHSLTDRGGDG